MPPVLNIEFGPPQADFGSLWSPPVRKFRRMQQTTKVGIPLKFSITISVLLSSPLLGQLDALVPSALKASKLVFVPPNLLGPPHICATCVDFEDRVSAV